MSVSDAESDHSDYATDSVYPLCRENIQMPACCSLLRLPAVFPTIRSPAFLLHEAGNPGTAFAGDRLYVIGELLYDFRLDFVPNSEDLSRLSVDMLDAEQANETGPIDLCCVIGVGAFIPYFQDDYTGLLLSIDHEAAYQSQDDRTAHLFSVSGQNYRDPRNSLLFVQVIKLHRMIGL